MQCPECKAEVPAYFTSYNFPNVAAAVPVGHYSVHHVLSEQKFYNYLCHMNPAAGCATPSSINELRVAEGLEPIETTDPKLHAWLNEPITPFTGQIVNVAV